MSRESVIQKIVERYRNLLPITSKYNQDGNNPIIVIVTKNQPADLILEVSRRIKNPIFGENRIQEALPKIEFCGISNISWHFIGSLQRNKVKKTLDKFSLIESLDRISLANEIEKWASKMNIVTKCLLQVDICQDGSKFGIHPSEEAIEEFLQRISLLSHIKIQGLMTIAPYVPPEETRAYFRRMRNLFENLKADSSLPTNVEMKILSMGMSNDYLIALQEGSNCIRLGTAIFG
ncbi:MAG: YggS family pyridoxal phosphate-dependent enzyme [Candidatus Hodarchaeota archaeon]